MERKKSFCLLTIDRYGRTNVSLSSMTVSCVPGSEGGETQHFVLKLNFSTQSKFNRYIHCLMCSWDRGRGNPTLCTQAQFQYETKFNR